MKVSLQTSTGIDIKLHSARFRTVRGNIDGQAGTAELAPAATVGHGLIETAARLGGVPTATALLASGQSRFGVLYACDGSDVAALLFDLGEPGVRTWFDSAQRAGHLPLVLASTEKSKLVRVPLDKDIEHLALRASGCLPAGADDLTTAMQAVIAQFEDGEMLASWGIDVARLKRASISLLTPTQGAERKELH